MQADKKKQQQKKEVKTEEKGEEQEEKSEEKKGEPAGATAGGEEHAGRDLIFILGMEKLIDHRPVNSGKIRKKHATKFR